MAGSSRLACGSRNLSLGANFERRGINCKKTEAVGPHGSWKIYKLSGRVKPHSKQVRSGESKGTSHRLPPPHDCLKERRVGAVPKRLPPAREPEAQTHSWEAPQGPCSC